MDVRDAYVILNSLQDIGAVRVQQLLRHFETPVDILQASPEALCRAEGIGQKRAKTISQWRQKCDLDTELKLCDKAGVQIVTSVDQEYPEHLRQIATPPLCLYVKGDTSVLKQCLRGVAVVGTRRPNQYGSRMARFFANALGVAGWVVVSGLAVGIDAIAHKSALEAGGKTVAMIGSGLAHLYPQDNVRLAHEIVADGGAIVSEFPMRMPPSRQTFPMRNRIVSGITAGTLVVQAGENSGALITASHALEQNRLVFAVPGPADSPHSRGCHGLIKEGAVLAERLEDILQEFQQAGQEVVARRARAKNNQNAQEIMPVVSQPVQFPELDEEEKQVYTCIDGEVSIDQVMRAVSLKPQRVLAALVKLEMRHIIQQLPGKKVVRIGEVNSNV